MAKIPQMDSGSLPSGVPRAQIEDGASSLFKGLGDLADTGLAVAQDADKQQAEKLRGILGAKQAISNEVAGNTLSLNYEEDVTGDVEQIKTAFAKNPGKAAEAFIPLARAKAENYGKSAQNGETGLDFARQSGAIIRNMTRHLHDWALQQQTLNIKDDLSEQVNIFTRKAETLPTAEALDAHLNSNTAATLEAQMRLVYGKDASKKMYETRAAAVDGWVNIVGTKDPYTVANAVDDANDKSPLVRYGDKDARKGWRKSLEASAEGLTRTREYEQIKQNIGRGGDIAKTYLAGDVEKFAGVVVSERQAISQQRLAIKAGVALETANLKKLGIDPQGRTGEDLLALLNDREKFVNALDHANRRQISLTAQDDPASVGALMVQMNKALKSKNGKDMAAIAQQQTRVAEALAGERVSGATATQMFATMALAMQTAADNQENIWGPNTVKTFHEPREAGIAELNRQLGGALENIPGNVEERKVGQLGAPGPFANLSPEVKAAIRLDYEAMFNAALTNKEPADKKATRRMALRAISYRTGKHIPGAD